MFLVVNVPLIHDKVWELSYVQIDCQRNAGNKYNCQKLMTNFLFLLDDSITLTPAIDIFAFGMCALETATLEISSNSETGGSYISVTFVVKFYQYFPSGPVSKESIEKCIDSIEDEGQKDFIRKCLIKDPNLRPRLGVRNIDIHIC